IALKRFFGGGTTTADGEEVAWENIRRKLKEIVDGEDKSKPLSDEALVDELAKHGFELARRTVTKYRKATDIPSSRQRREYCGDGSDRRAVVTAFVRFRRGPNHPPRCPPTGRSS